MRLLRCGVGAYAGQLIEYPEHVAENLLQNGLAEEPTDEERAEFYRSEEEATLPESETRDFPRHVGGGWYELSNGKKVQGKEDAEAAEAEL